MEKKSKLNTFTKSICTVIMAKSYRLLLPYPGVTISERNGKDEHVIMSFIQPLTLMFCPFSSYVLVCLPPTVLHPVTHLLNTAWPSSECLEKIGILLHLASGFCPNVIKVVSFTQMTLSKKSLPLKCHFDILPLF